MARNNLLKGFHNHHIVPKHIGGTDSPDNLVLLHPIDHAIAHYVRYKMFKKRGDGYAFYRLMSYLNEEGVHISLTGVSAWNKGKKLSEKHKKSLSKSHIGKKWSEKQQLSHDASKEKFKEIMIKAMAKPETKEKHRIAVSKGKKGKKQTEEQKLNTSIAIKVWWAKRKEAQIEVA